MSTTLKYIIIYIVSTGAIFSACLFVCLFAATFLHLILFGNFRRPIALHIISYIIEIHL